MFVLYPIPSIYGIFTYMLFNFYGKCRHGYVLLFFVNQSLHLFVHICNIDYSMCIHLSISISPSFDLFMNRNYLSIDLCIQIYIYSHIYIAIFTCIYIYIYIHTFIYRYLFTYIYIYLYTYVFKYIYTYLHLFKVNQSICGSSCNSNCKKKLAQENKDLTQPLEAWSGCWLVRMGGFMPLFARWMVRAETKTWHILG